MLRNSIFILFFLVCTLSFGQERNVDSLLDNLSIAENELLQASICIQLSQIYTTSAPDSALFWLNKSLYYTKTSSAKNLSYTSICSIRGKTHVEISNVYLLNNLSFEHALSHADTAFLILFRESKDDNTSSHNKDALTQLSQVYSLLGKKYLEQGDISNSINMFTKALNIMHELGNQNGVARMNNNLGVLHRRRSNLAQSLQHFQKASDIFHSQNDSVAIASVLVNIGSVSYDIGALERSLENYHKALSVFQKTGNREEMASTLINIGGVMVESKNFEESIPYFNRALDIYTKLNDKRGIASSYLSIGSCYLEQNRLDSAFIQLNKSKNTYLSVNDRIGEAEALQYIGQVYFRQNNFVAALRTYSNALNIASEIGLNSITTNVNYNIALVYYSQGRYNEALKKANVALKQAKEYDLLSIQIDSYKIISELLEKKGDYREALDSYKKFYLLNDSLYSKDRAYKFAEMETLYKLEEKQAAISKLESEKALKIVALKSAEIQILRQRTQSLVSLAVLLFLSAIMFFLYKQFKIKRTSNFALQQQNAEILQKNEEILVQKEEIEFQKDELEKQKELLQEKTQQVERFNWLITDSIDYASSIQGALLPSNEVFLNYFSDNFLMLFPKDVVSGDFYWAYPKNDNIIIALADCTGHGVPGGFMSMLGISALTELMGRQITKPADILNNLRLLVIESLKQTGRIGEHHEGMDIAIISYTQGNSYIEFAGANHPIWILRNIAGKYELFEQKGDRMPISFHPKMKPFSSYKLDVEKGDQIYMFSDGYRHQLGGPSQDQKFGMGNFKNLILDNAHLSMDEQKNVIEDTFFRWVIENDQLDDITILGIKV